MKHGEISLSICIVNSFISVISRCLRCRKGFNLNRRAYDINKPADEILQIKVCTAYFGHQLTSVFKHLGGFLLPRYLKKKYFMNRIDSAGPEHVGLILEMIYELADWEGHSDQVEATEELLSQSLFGSESIAKVLLAYIDEKLVGYLIYCPKFATYTGRNEIYLQDIYLRPDARGTGLGLLLMNKLAEIAKDSGASRIEWFVDENNSQALVFYEKLGAKVCDAIKVVRLELPSMANRAK